MENTETKPAKPASTPATTLETDCPRCGRRMVLPLPADADPADAQRLARLVLCDTCSEWQSAHRDPEADAVRLPYRDD